MPLERLDGQMILGCGLEAVPAKVSVQAGSGEASQISVTYGLHGSGSLASARLTSSLANRLRPKTDWLGSTLFSLTWKERVTPAGRRIPALRASGRRTSGAGCTSWPTPQAIEQLDTPEKKRQRGSHVGLNLPVAAQMAAWPTPQSHDERKRGNTEADHHHFPHDLSNAAEMASWATPRSEDSECAGAHRGKEDGLHSQSRLASWATPANRDYRHANLKTYRERGGQSKGEQLQNQVKHQICSTASGPTPNGSRAATKSIGQLNPAHSRWLMGLPTVWDDCAAMVTRSTRSRRKDS